MTADNCVMAIYILTIMSIPAEGGRDSSSGSDGGGSTGHRPAAVVTAESMALSIAAAALACTLGTQLAAAVGMPSLGLALMSVLASGLAVLGARLAAGFRSGQVAASSSSSGGCSSAGQACQAAPPASPFTGAEALGGSLMMLFFATIGAAAGSLQALRGCGWLVLFILLQLRWDENAARSSAVLPDADLPRTILTCPIGSSNPCLEPVWPPCLPHPCSIHLAVCLAGGRLLRLPMQSVLIASNANVGGPATAAAMASSKGWPHMVQPAMLTGCLGYAIATALGCAMGQWMRGWYAF